MDPGSQEDAAIRPAEDATDENGVDRTQIRAFLEHPPRERLRRVLRQAAFFRRVRELNGDG